MNAATELFCPRSSALISGFNVMTAPLRTLIVEDDARYRAMLVTMLRDLGCEPTPMASAMNALQWLQQHDADVVLLDLNMPVMDGLTFLARFRQRHQETPVIILTGVGSLQAAQAAIRHHATDFLTKPCHLGNIETALDRARRELAKLRDRSRCTTEAEGERLQDSSDGSAVQSTTSEARDATSDAAPPTLVEIERQAILASLQRHRGNRSATAIELGLSRRTLHYRLAEYRRLGLLAE